MELNSSELEKIRKARNSYQREWRKRNPGYNNKYFKEARKKNPDKYKAYQNKYWLKKAKKLEKEGEL